MKIKEIILDMIYGKKCPICGKLITGGCYNMPSGVLCTVCHDKKYNK